MPRENINDDTTSGFRTEVGWERDKGCVQVATTNAASTLTLSGDNPTDPAVPFTGWHVTYTDRASVNRAIWALRKARDETFGVAPGEDLTADKARAEAAQALTRTANFGDAPGNVAALTGVAHAWMALASMLPSAEALVMAGRRPPGFAATAEQDPPS